MIVIITGLKDDKLFYVFRNKPSNIFVWKLFWIIEFLGCEMHWETQNIEFIWGKNDARYMF